MDKQGYQEIIESKGEFGTQFVCLFFLSVIILKGANVSCFSIFLILCLCLFVFVTVQTLRPGFKLSACIVFTNRKS